MTKVLDLQAHLEGHATLGLKGRATLSARCIPTGRIVDGTPLHGQVEGWAKQTVSGKIMSDPTATLFSEALKGKLPASRDLMLYRGRWFPNDYHPRSGEFGPPPDRKPGRYSLESSSVLYLSDSEEAVRTEAVKDESCPALWCQRFCVPAMALSLADFCCSGPDSVEAHTFWFAELAGELKGLPATWTFSQAVASLVADCFCAMQVPSVRGTKDARYMNVVVFRPEPQWNSWLDHGYQPKQL